MRNVGTERVWVRTRHQIHLDTSISPVVHVSLLFIMNRESEERYVEAHLYLSVGVMKD